jgi:hypothetical protein
MGRRWERIEGKREMKREKWKREKSKTWREGYRGQ